MKCGITGTTGMHIPFDVEYYAIPRIGDYHKTDRIFDHLPWPGYKDNEKIYSSIDTIDNYMKNEYNRNDNDILSLYRISKPQNYFSGAVIYVFSDLNINIRGEVFIVPICYLDRNITHFFYIFRTIIKTPFGICPVVADSFEIYNKFCKELSSFIKDLNLTMVDKLFSSPMINRYTNRYINGYEPKDVSFNPIIFKYVENLELNSFDDFMTRIEVFADKYLLQSIGRKCTDFGKHLE